MHYPKVKNLGYIYTLYNIEIIYPIIKNLSCIHTIVRSISIILSI